MRNISLFFFIFLLNFSLFAQPTEGLIAHYPLDGNAQDLSGNNFNGTVFNAVAAENRFGLASKAMSFDGDNDWIEVPDNQLLRLSGDFTISLWLKIEELSNPVAYSIISKRTSIASDGYFMPLNGFDHSPLDPGTVNFIASGGSDPFSLSNVSVPMGEWVNILYQFDTESNICKGYFNNELVASAEINSLNQNTTATLKIGKDGQSFMNDFDFDGLLDDIRIYNRLLTAEEKEEIMNEDVILSTESSLNSEEPIDISIFPNPTKDILTIRNTMSNVETIKIVNIEGKVILERKYQEDMKIDVRSQIQGIYYLILEDENGQMLGHKKFVKIGTNRA